MGHASFFRSVCRESPAGLVLYCWITFSARESGEIFRHRTKTPMEIIVQAAGAPKAGSGYRLSVSQ